MFTTVATVTVSIQSLLEFNAVKIYIIIISNWLLARMFNLVLSRTLSVSNLLSVGFPFNKMAAYYNHVRVDIKILNLLLSLLAVLFSLFVEV